MEFMDSIVKFNIKDINITVTKLIVQTITFTLDFSIFLHPGNVLLKYFRMCFSLIFFAENHGRTIIYIDIYSNSLILIFLC